VRLDSNSIRANSTIGSHSCPCPHEVHPAKITVTEVLESKDDYMANVPLVTTH